MVVEKPYPERRYIQATYEKIQRRDLNVQNPQCLNCQSAETCGFHPGLCCACVQAALPKAPHRGVESKSVGPGMSAPITPWS